MSQNNPAAEPMANASREEIASALFANLVVQQTNMAFMFLGRVPHPETGEVIRDLESAKYFIDQLEMLEHKTRGNLDKREDGLLKQSLTGLRMAFVEAADDKAPAPEMQPISSDSADSPTSIPETPAASSHASEPTSSEVKPAAEDESRKKFSKKY